MASSDFVDRRKLYVHIADDLRRDLAAGRFPVGSLFPTVGELIDRFGVAKPTVEHALDILRSERLIVSRQGARTIVGAVPDAPTGANAHREPGEEFKTIFDELQQIRDHVEQLTVKLKELYDRAKGL